MQQQRSDGQVIQSYLLSAKGTVMCMIEDQARESGVDIKVNFKRTDAWYSYRQTYETHTAFKSIINKENGQILGGHVLESQVEEIINLFAIAMNQNIKASELKKMVYAYPSHASEIPYMV